MQSTVMKPGNLYATQCTQLYLNTSHAWRSSPVAGDTTVDDYNRISLASSCGVLYFNELMIPSPKQKLFPWEQDYLSTPLIESVEDLARADNSVIRLITSPSGGNSFTLGSTVKFAITLFNGRNERRTLGGDILNVWLVSEKPKAAIAADVTDHSNGTYTAVTVLPWSGNVTVKAALVHQREKFRMMFYIQRIFKTIHWFVGFFESVNVSEATPCLPFPSLPGHSSDELCNFTELNGSPWYCGRPVKKDYLNCLHYTSVRRLAENSNPPLTPTETWLLWTPHDQRPFFLPNNISIHVSTDEMSKADVISLPQLKCSERDMSLTFQENNSYGFFYNGSWRPSTCQLPELTTKLLVDCLKDTQVILVGDSNSREQYDILTRLVPCESRLVRLAIKWLRELKCVNTTNNITFQFLPHSFPFFGLMEDKRTHSDVYSEVQLLDSIPKDGKYIVHLHTFIHLAPFHLSLLETRLKLVRDAMKRLLDRNPHVIIIYQSAHSFYSIQSMNGAFILEIQRNILKGLGDRVMFMFTWPMTVATDNNDLHPAVAISFTHYYMGHICGRI
ncbi:hypothetical protein Btru_016313 [Bulinus truncatus]|nr:hypothetical protein Btru_016313 [Bulinus truncatus]